MSPTPDPNPPDTAPIGIAAQPPAPLKPALSHLPAKARLRQFANRLKGNALWMTQFLHGGK